MWGFVAGSGFANKARNSSKGKREVESTREAEKGSIGEDEAVTKLSSGGWRGRRDGWIRAS